MNTKKGFTLIEMMFVIMIIGVMMGVAMVKLDGTLPYFRFRATAREIANLIKLAKSTAATQGITIYIQYDISNQKFWLLCPEVPTDKLKEDLDIELMDQKKNVILFASSIPEGIRLQDVITGTKETFESGIVSMECTPFGTVDQHVVHLMMKEDEDVRYYSVAVSPLTGFIKFSDKYLTVVSVSKDETEYQDD
ncbi:MAG: prepilin-type N-terminal cleavage/methylation domain-containing protein [Planctomycetes bacterium]|nr:prepilin-type N-terminal cleavage/methylation domain-containing protein [Planctomycetota bacterium]